MDQTFSSKKWYSAAKVLHDALATFEKISIIFLVLSLSVIVFMGMSFRYLPFDTGLLTLATEELGNLCLVWLWLWAGAAVHRLDAHFRLTVIIDRLGERAVFLFDIVNNVILLFLMLDLMKYNILHFVISFGVRSMGMEWPVAVFVFPLLLGCPLIGLYTLIRIVALIKGGVSAR